MKPQYRKTETPDGKYLIRYALRLGKFLVITTSFDAMRYIDLADSHFRLLPDVKDFVCVQVYDDGSGYYIFRLKANINRSRLWESVEKSFTGYFKK